MVRWSPAQPRYFRTVRTAAPEEDACLLSLGRGEAAAAGTGYMFQKVNVSFYFLFMLYCAVTQVYKRFLPNYITSDIIS